MRKSLSPCGPGIHTPTGALQIQCHSDSIESVQKLFLLFCLRGLVCDCANWFPSYEARLGLTKLQTMKRGVAVLGFDFR